MQISTRQLRRITRRDSRHSDTGIKHGVRRLTRARRGP
jgi:hypothetical protein